jgi:hypothetical protein
MGGAADGAAGAAGARIDAADSDGEASTDALAEADAVDSGKEASTDAAAEAEVDASGPDASDDAASDARADAPADGDIRDAASDGSNDADAGPSREPVIGCAPAALPDSASFEILDMPPQPDASGTNRIESFGVGVSANGAAVVGAYLVSSTEQHAFRWVGGRSIDLFRPADPSGFATATSCDGSVVVGEFFVFQAYRWSASTGLRRLPGGSARPVALSTDGRIAAGGLTERDAGPSELAVRWLNDGATLSVLDDRAATVFGMTSDGSAVFGFLYGRGVNSAFRWAPASGVRVLFSVDWLSQLVTVSADGSTILLGHARWTEQLGLQPLPCTGSCQAVALSSRGRIVVLRDYNEERMLVWDEKHGARQLADVLTQHGADLGGERIHDITAMSHDARVFVGTTASSRAYRAVLPAHAFD